MCPEAVEIQRLLDKGNSKSAVEAAKQLHKRLHTAESESLLVDAYLARVRSMLAHRMTAEAEALLRVVRERHPGFAQRLAALKDCLVSAGGGLDELLAPLNDPATPAEVRAGIEQTLRKELTDPSALATCRTLPAGHPLLQAASAIASTLAAVTTGPVDDDALSLPEVSRRSPLAPWKPLLRAIAYYYRQEDERCLEQLAGIDPESAPARLIPALTALAGKAGDGRLTPAASALMAQAAGNLGPLRDALMRIEIAVEAYDTGMLLRDLREAAALIRQECPELAAPFRQRAAVLAIVADAPPEAVVAAIGGAPRYDAQFLLMRAREIETTDLPPLIASHMWDEFRHAALKERWFPAGGPEEAVVLLRMAELADSIDQEECSREEDESIRRALSEVDGGVGRAGAAVDFLDPASLYAQAARMDPSPETFTRWGDLAEKSQSVAVLEAAMNAWQMALPQDVRPLLRLMRAAERRGALKKAMGYLRRAEVLDGVNSEVRRARLRLLIAGVVRHLRQRKPRLAASALAELRSLPQARENHRTAFVAALHFYAAVLDQRDSDALAATSEVTSILGSQLATQFAVAGVGNLCGMPAGIQHDRITGRWVDAIPPVCEMGWDLGYSFIPPETAKPAILRELPDADLPALERFAAVILRLDWNDLAFAVSSAGFARGNDRDAYFLRLRARAYVGAVISQWEDCLLAAITLAQSGGDNELARQAREEWAGMSFHSYLGQPPPVMPLRAALEVLQREKSGRRPPAAQYNRFSDLTGYAASSRRRRRRRGRSRRDDDITFDLPF